jgi:glutamine cyclotransferase
LLQFGIRFNIPITSRSPPIIVPVEKTRAKINELAIKNSNLSIKAVARSRYLLLGAILLVGCNGRPGEGSGGQLPSPGEVPLINYGVGHVYPHDTTSYTEGFVFYDHHFFESSGAPEEFPQTRSMIGIDDLGSGKVDKKIELDRRRYFGEGIVFFKGKLYQLTYKNHTGFIYDAANYRRVDSFTFANKEGWALTTDSTSLIMSDGTSNLTYLDPVSLKPVKVLAVTLNSVPLDSLNELEYIGKYIYANRFTQNYLVKINPVDGKVVGKLDLTSLVEQEKNRNPGCDVLNGIAYDPGTDKVFVTGKLWSGIYEIVFSH